MAAVQTLIDRRAVSFASSNTHYLLKAYRFYFNFNGLLVIINVPSHYLKRFGILF